MCQPAKTTATESTEVLYQRVLLKQRQLSEILLNHIMETTADKNGVRSLASVSYIKELLRIVGGTPALEGEFNECCLIGRRNLNGTIDWFCTGVLIHPRVVVSAAHCVVAGQPYVVALETNSQNNLSNAILVNTRKTIMHPKYVAQTHLYDLSVLVLQEQVTTPPVPLVTSEIINNASEVELVGFGNDHVTLNQGFGIKRKVSVDIVSIRRNPNDDLNFAEGTYGYESDLEFVAGGKGFDTCNGDSGGPVYIHHGIQRWVAGLTSRATDNRVNPCGDGGIYTRLDIHTPFINSIIQTL